MVKSVEVGFDEFSEVMSYEPTSGQFTWKVTVGTRSKAGQRAGVWQRMQNGKDYYSITYKGRKYSGAQVAWLLHYGSWPDRSVFFIDEDTTNLRISNLKMADHKAIKVSKADGSIGYKMSKEQVRHYALSRNYGLSFTEYAEMYAKQGGVCAICKKPETHRVPGRKTANSATGVRDMSVDHDHKTGAVRELLCNSCNHLLGAAKDNPDVLLAAAEYLKRHAASDEPRTPADQTDRADAVQTDRPTLAQEV